MKNQSNPGNKIVSSRKSVSRITTALSCLIALSLPPQLGCVTVNVNFPESAVQKETDDFVRDLYRAKEKGKAASNGTSSGNSPAPASASTHAQASPSAKPAISGGKPAAPKPATTSPAPKHTSSWNLALVPSAFAAEGFRVSTDKALQIRDRMSARVDEVLAQKRAGVLGETNEGLLTIKAPDKLKKLQTQRVEKMVAEENADRNDLYQEIVRANGLDKARTKDIQQSFARSFQAESPSGTWVQDSNGKWEQKP